MITLTAIGHKQRRNRNYRRVWPVAPTSGIGTTAPTQALDVNGTIRAAHVSITGSSCGWSGWACSPTCAAGYYQAGTMMGAANNCNGTGPNVQIYCCSF